MEMVFLIQLNPEGKIPFEIIKQYILKVFYVDNLSGKQSCWSCENVVNTEFSICSSLLENKV